MRGSGFVYDQEVPLDPDIAMLLTSDLVTDAITCGTGQTVTLAIRCSDWRAQIPLISSDPLRKRQRLSSLAHRFLNPKPKPVEEQIDHRSSE